MPDYDPRKHTKHINIFESFGVISWTGFFAYHLLLAAYCFLAAGAIFNVIRSLPRTIST
ncbi:MAG: hypothetical protein QOI77_3171, partial [Blastocatellia bacterium]|nr:hypothetical protein [Blastocatellia bacterium]